MRRITIPLLTLAAALALFAPPAALAGHEIPSGLGEPLRRSGRSAPFRCRLTSIPPRSQPKTSSGCSVTNTGEASSDGSPITIADELPKGISLDPQGASGENSLAGLGLTNSLGEHEGFPREPKGANFNCVRETCVYNAVVIPDQTLELLFPVDVSPEAQGLSPLTNVVRVSGGGAAAACSRSRPWSPNTRPASGWRPGGGTTALSNVRAGAHPDISTTYAFASVNTGGSLAAYTKDVVYRLPAGVASDFSETPACTPAQFSEQECPVDSQVGVTTVDLEQYNSSSVGTFKRYVEPVFNIQPETGILATLGFEIAGIIVTEGQITLRPREAGGEPYGADVTFHNIDSAALEVLGGSLTVWGVPSASYHNPLRYVLPPIGPACEGGPVLHTLCGHFGFSAEGLAPIPYFVNPTSCGPQLHSEFALDSWEEPGRYVTTQMPYGPFTGCDGLTIEPQVEVQPSASSAESPSGLSLTLETPQHYENTDVVASNFDHVTVALPEGMTVNPSAGPGLAACTEAQFAYEGEVVEPEPGRGCPREAKLGTAHARSPGVPYNEEAVGSIYLAKPYENKFSEPGHPNGSLIALYLVLRIPKRGIVVTDAGKVEANPVTGQLTTTFDENPQLPVSDFTFVFHQGATSPLVTPPTCGTFTTQMDLTPFSEPLQEHLLSATFEISSGVNGGPCPVGGTLPFAPKLVSGTQNNVAGAYSPFYLRILREDGEQELTKFTTVLPPGVTGNLTGIPFCPDADIQAARSVTGAEELEHPSCPQPAKSGIRSSKRASAACSLRRRGRSISAAPTTARRCRSSRSPRRRSDRSTSARS